MPIVPGAPQSVGPPISATKLNLAFVVAVVLVVILLIVVLVVVLNSLHPFQRNPVNVV